MVTDNLINCFVKTKMYLPFENGLAVSIAPMEIGVEVALLGMDGDFLYNVEPIPGGVTQVFNGEALASLLLKIETAQGL